MEQFVLGIFQEQLSKFIVGFRKEQVNANLLNGKGEIRDVDLNCDFLNETASKVSPLVEFESVHVSKVSFYVSSWTNIRKAPILIDIEHVSAKLREPLDYLSEREGRKEIAQITRQQLVSMIQQGLVKTRGAYNLFDRILDNLTVEVSSVQVSFQPCGKFKTRRQGPWTPPAIQLSLANIRFVSVNEYGQEAPPEEVWRHNHHRNHSNNNTASLLIYKKCEMEYKISIKPLNGNRIPLITGKENKVELQVAIQRRIRDGEILAVQMDATIPHVTMDLAQKVIPEVAHAVAGVAYCVAKDRAFQDPLLSPQHESATRRASTPIVTTLDSKDDGEQEKTQQAQEATTEAIDVNIEEEGSSSEGEEDDEKATDSAGAEPKPQSPTKTTSRYALPDEIKQQPVIVLPNGIMIHERISLSVSIYDAVVRGRYGPAATTSQLKGSVEEESTDFGCFEMRSKGCIAEAIWPKTTKEKGGYVQASVSYFTLEEKHKQQIKTLMSGGVQFQSTDPVESPSKPLSEVGLDETFPLYEDRVVRPDPLGLRHTFPAQAFGLKATVDFLDDEVEGESELAKKKEDKIQVLHEVGVDRVEFVVESQSWCRILSFVANEQGDGFDPRWHSGNWTAKLTPDIMASPETPLNLDECLQPTKQLFLDENEFISSDLFNLTARITRVETRVPACIHKDVKSRELVMELEEAMLLVSSALPRTMLSGRIGNSVNGDDSSKKGVIEFPNDVTDVAYELEKSEDPSNRQRGVATSRAISTFRAQMTLRGCSVKLRPSIDFYAQHSEPLLAPCEVTMIFCFEGEPPEIPADENVSKLVVFCSVLVHRYHVNLDLDLLAAALSTLLYHKDALQQRLIALSEIIQRSITDDTEFSSSAAVDALNAGEPGSLQEPNDQSSNHQPQERIPRSLKGRRVLVQRQLRNSRESGGINIALGIQIAEFRLRLWRQHVLVSQRSEGETRSIRRTIPAVLMIDCFIKDLELGFEAALKNEDRRAVGKGCLTALAVKACDFEALRSHEQPSAGDTRDEDEPPKYLVEVLTLPTGDDLGGGAQPGDYAFGFRLEEVLKTNRQWAVSTELPNGGVLNFLPKLTELLALQIFEALLVPYDPSPADYLKSGAAVFPDGSVGGILQAAAHAVEQPTRIDFDMLKGIMSDTSLGPTKQIDAALQVFLEQCVPETVEMILLRSRIAGMVVAVPFQETNGIESSLYMFKSHFADFVATYFLDGKPARDEILRTFARKNEPWLSLVGSCDKGLYHRLQSRQSLLNRRPKEDLFLVPPFNFASSYSQSKARVELDEGLKLDGVEQFDDFVSCARDVALRLRQMTQNMKMLTTSLRSAVGEVVTKERPELSARGSPAGVACTRVTASVRGAKDAISDVHLRLQNCGDSVGRLFARMQHLMDLQRFEAFKKEKDRLSALALVSSQVTGWLRIGSPGRTGQRGTITATLWPYWAVLRKGMILVHSAPGSTQVLDIISLQGAKLYQLSGGQRKRDLKRAFGLAQSSGMLHLITIPSDREYHDWIREMQRSIIAYGGSSNGDSPEGVAPSSLPSALALPAESNVESDPVAVESVQPVGQPNSQGRIGRSFSRAVQAAKATKQAVVDRRRREGSGESFEDSEDDRPSHSEDRKEEEASGDFSSSSGTDFTETESSIDSSREASEPQTRGRQLRNRLAGVSMATKSRLGNAVQKAREKRQAAVAERNRQNRPNTQPVAVAPPETEPVTTTQTTSSNEWQCPTCTFLNRTSNEQCEMCGTAKESVPSAVISPEGTPVKESDQLSESQTSMAPQVDDVSQEKPASDDGELSDEPERAGMRMRLGAAVRSVALGNKRNNKTLPPSDASAAGAPGSLRMRDVSIAEPLDTSKDPFGEENLFEEQLMKRLEGNWFVRVKIKDDALAEPVSAAAQHVEGAEQQRAEGPDGALAATSNGVEDASSEPETAAKDGGVVSLSIEIYQEKGLQSSADGGPYSQVSRFFSDVYSLHTSISECVGRLPPPASYSMEGRSDDGALTQSLAKGLGLTALEAVRTTARLLAGLLDESMSFGEQPPRQLTSYHADVVAEFLNSMLDTELPIDGLLMLTEFLELSEVSTKGLSLSQESGEQRTARPYRSEMEREFEAMRLALNETRELTSFCQAELVHAERTSLTADRVIATQEESLTMNALSGVASPQSLLNTTNAPTLSSRFQNAVHDALMNVMAERDQARAKYVAADVLHVHELEQERKRNKRLEEEIESSKGSLQELKERARKKKMEASNDEELMSLCQQLSSEISARTSAALEIERLKEMRETERRNEAMEKESLQDEIQRLRAELDQERQAGAAARQSSASWQKSFEDLVEFRK